MDINHYNNGLFKKWTLKEHIKSGNYNQRTYQKVDVKMDIKSRRKKWM